MIVMAIVQALFTVVEAIFSVLPNPDIAGLFEPFVGFAVGGFPWANAIFPAAEYIDLLKTVVFIALGAYLVVKIALWIYSVVPFFGKGG